MGREVNGGFADYCVAQNSHTYPLPEVMNGKTGAAVQVLTTVLHSQDRGEVGLGDIIVVSGLGVTGLMHIQLVKFHGAKTVIGFSRNSYKREVALSLGADFAVAHGGEAKKPCWT